MPLCSLRKNFENESFSITRLPDGTRFHMSSLSRATPVRKTLPPARYVMLEIIIIHASAYLPESASSNIPKKPLSESTITVAGPSDTLIASSDNISGQPSPSGRYTLMSWRGASPDSTYPPYIRSKSSSMTLPNPPAMVRTADALTNAPLHSSVLRRESNMRPNPSSFLTNGDSHVRRYMNLNADSIRADFAHDTTYLNNASASPMPLQAVRAVGDFLQEYNRAGPDSPQADELVRRQISETRSLISAIIGCSPDELTLTQSVTDGINMVAGGLVLPTSSDIIIRGMEHEHHSNLYPWLRLSSRCRLISLDVDTDGFFDMGQLRTVSSQKTALVALSHALYNTGAILPVYAAGQYLDPEGIPYLVDAAQSVGCVPVDVKKMRCDFMSFNGSKWLCGPMGTGIFYCRAGSEEQLVPLAVGGESATYTGTLEYKPPPDRFQAGFRNYAGLAGLASSARYITSLGIDNIRRHVTGLGDMLREGLLGVPGAEVFGPADPEMRTSIVPFTIRGHDCEYVVERLRKDGIILAVREIENHKIVRASPHVFNTPDEIMQVVSAVRRL